MAARDPRPPWRSRAERERTPRRRRGWAGPRSPATRPRSRPPPATRWPRSAAPCRGRTRDRCRLGPLLGARRRTRARPGRRRPAPARARQHLRQSMRAIAVLLRPIRSRISRRHRQVIGGHARRSGWRARPVPSAPRAGAPRCDRARTPETRRERWRRPRCRPRRACSQRSGRPTANHSLMSPHRTTTSDAALAQRRRAGGAPACAARRAAGRGG